MKRVTGIGGIVFLAKDPVALRDWYKRHLGIDGERPTTGSTIWSIGGPSADTNEPGRAPFMITYRVADLAKLLDALRKEGCNVDEKVDDEESGKFGWVVDPEGNTAELWQPPPGQ